MAAGGSESLSEDGSAADLLGAPDDIHRCSLYEPRIRAGGSVFEYSFTSESFQDRLMRSFAAP